MEKIKIIKSLQRVFLYFLPFIIFIPFMAFFYRAYMKKISAFGCFDDCFNIVAGYFINQGRTLYSDIFFNHQMLMAYLSTFIQNTFDPINIYELILDHRRFLFVFSFFMDLLIIFRFRFVGLGFVLLYEATKFYIFGDRFLAESFVVYPFVYLLGMVWFKINEKPLMSFEYILAGVFTWFTIFMREPYIPLALLLYVLFLWGKKHVTLKAISIFVFLSLSAITFMTVSIPDYFFNIFTVNQQTILSAEIRSTNLFGTGFFKIFGYPIFLLLDGKWNFFREILVVLSFVFLFLVGFLLVRLRQFKNVVVLVGVLGLANIRVVDVGEIFYAAFHMVVWYGMFIMVIFLLIHDFGQVQVFKKIFFLVAIVLVCVIFYSIFSKKAFVWEDIDQHSEFITNYGNYLSYGETIKILSNDNQTLFVDGFDELIHWQANRPSPYKYSWYTSFMPYISKYREERTIMLERNPPDFYYGSCPKEVISSRLLPQNVKKDYARLFSHGKPSCLHVKKKIIDKISKEQWKKAEEFGFSI